MANEYGLEKSLELELERVLRDAFPHDQIVPVAKGVHGGDVIHRVMTPTLQYCGTIPNPAINPAGCGTTANPQTWRQVTIITTPRYARFQMQFDF